MRSGKGGAGRWLAAIEFAALTALGLCVVSPASAGGSQLQFDRDNVLHDLSADKVAQRRASCAAGAIPAWLTRLRSSGFQTLSAGAYCVTVLTRAGRDGTLGYVTLGGKETTAAVAFDTGFVNGYLKHEALPADAPGMAVLLPIADRCLDQKEAKLRLCGLAGQVLGARAALGELVPIS